MAVPNSGNDRVALWFHNWTMAKPRHRKGAAPEWYVAQWLEYLGMQQTDLIDATGRSKGRISELVTGSQRFNSDDLRAFSRALGVTRGFILEVNPLAVAREVAERGRIAQPPVPTAEAKRRA